MLTGKRLVVLTLVLAGVNAFAPLSMDLYLPAFPNVLLDFHSTQSAVQWTLTADLIGIAVGQLVIGPLSDAHGRRWLLIGCTALAAIAAALCFLAPSIGWLMFWRFWQGFGGGGGIAISRALATDVTKGTAAARLFSLFLTLSFVAPIVAPVIGGFLLSVTGSWRACFLVLALSSGALAVLIWALIPETLPRELRHTGGLRQTGRAFSELLRNRVFVGYTLTVVFAYAALFAYISSSSFVMQSQFGLTPIAFSVVFGVNAAGMLALGFWNARLVKSHPVRRLLLIGLIASSIAAVLLILVSLNASASALLVIALLFIIISSRGLVSSNAMVLGVEESSSTGSASAIMGASMFAGGLLVTPFLGLTPSSPATSMSIAIAISALLALLATAVLARPVRNADR